MERGFFNANGNAAQACSRSRIGQKILRKNPMEVQDRVAIEANLIRGAYKKRNGVLVVENHLSFQPVVTFYRFSEFKDGNRLTQTLGGITTTYSYGAGNDLLQTISMGGVTTQTIGYTDDGRMGTLDPGIESPGSQLITSLSYNQAAQLAAVNAGSSSLASYTYDGFGQRLLKTVSSTSGNIYQYGQNGMLLEETDQSGTAQADYIYLNGRPIADLDPSSGTLYYVHDDMLGTPQLASDSSQNAAWQATYGPFGQTTSVSGTITQNLRLPGQYFDVESGWDHNGFRNYVPDLGRYLEPDPLAMLGTARTYDVSSGRFISPYQLRFGMNYYAYVDNNPANSVDPLGLQTCKNGSQTKPCISPAVFDGSDPLKTAYALSKVMAKLTGKTIGIGVEGGIGAGVGVACPIFCTSEIVSVAQVSMSDSRRRGCGEVGSA